MVYARSAFRKALRESRYHQTQLKTDKLLNARVRNAKEYWKLRKEASGIHTNNSTLSSDSFVTYFKAINNPEDRFSRLMKTFCTLMIDFFIQNI